MSNTLKFYFDVISPYSWLAWRPLNTLIQQTNTHLECKPILFAALLNAHGHKGPAEIPSKRVYIFKDVIRVARKQNLDFKGPPMHPFNPLNALRMLTAVSDDQNKIRKLTGILLDACWSEGRDISDKKVLKQIATENGFDGDGLIKRIEDQDVKNLLRKNTEDAIKKGIFGGK